MAGTQADSQIANDTIMFAENLFKCFMICRIHFPNRFCQPPNGLRYLRVGGCGQCLGAGKTRSQKMPENAAESHTSGAPPHEREFMFHQRNWIACLDRLDNQWEYTAKWQTYKLPSAKQWRRALVAVPRCTLVSDQNDVSTGGAGG